MNVVILIINCGCSRIFVWSDIYNFVCYFYILNVSGILLIIFNKKYMTASKL